MLSLKLTLLTFIAAWVMFVSGENMITCEGDVHRLTCGIGLIIVKSTLYGRTDKDTCGNYLTPSETVNTSCSMKISTIADRCNGLRECELTTDILYNPDLCYGTYKYYNTTYNCISAKLAVICEHGYSTLDCGDDSVYIINANYGRANSLTCSSGLSNSLSQNTSCYAPNTLSTVAKLCNGHKSCTVEASHTIFTDPCIGTAKYLTVSYICIRKSLTCEDNTAVLICGTQQIKITSANYGRTDSTTCSSGRPDSQISETACNMPDTVNIVAARCDGQSHCMVPATNNVFSDPCYGTYKYLSISYSCI